MLRPYISSFKSEGSNAFSQIQGYVMKHSNKLYKKELIITLSFVIIGLL